jgi:hypothetical protein
MSWVNNVEYAGFQVIPIVWVILVGTVFNVAPYKKSGGDKSSECGVNSFEMVYLQKRRIARK